VNRGCSRLRSVDSPSSSAWPAATMVGIGFGCPGRRRPRRRLRARGGGATGAPSHDQVRKRALERIDEDLRRWMPLARGPPPGRA
jgi:hypothetical protein